MNTNTSRKVRNKGFTPVRYRTEDCVRIGWIVRQTPTRVLFHFADENCERWLPLEETRYMTEPLSRAQIEALLKDRTTNP